MKTRYKKSILLVIILVLFMSIIILIVKLISNKLIDDRPALISYNDKFIWTYTPNTKTDIVSINSLGFRDSEQHNTKPKNTKIIPI